MICDASFQASGYANEKVAFLVERLRRFYPEDHNVIVYEAAQFAFSEPKIHHCELLNLTMAPITSATTLVVPPARYEGVRSIAAQGAGAHAGGHHHRTAPAGCSSGEAIRLAIEHRRPG